MLSNHAACDESKFEDTREDDDSELNKRECNVDALVYDVVRREVSNQPGKNIDFNPLPNLHGRLKLMVDEKLVRMALCAILDKIVKQSHEGDSIRILTMRDQAFGSIIVICRGLSLVLQHLKDLFDGSGQNVAYARHIAELHGGSVSLSSIDNKGVRFIFRFPINAGAESRSETVGHC